jgi:ribosomal protein L11 methyltransferase
MNNDSWVEIACDVPAELADVLSSFLAALTGSGVCLENLSVDAFSASEIPDSPRMTLKAYLPDDADQTSKKAELERFLLELSSGRPDMHIPPPTLKTILTEEWSSNWKCHFKPLHIGKRLIILPSWEEVPPSPDQLLLRIDPGMAFGTGGHETTRLCLELLEHRIASFGAAPPSLLDLGTGSGILAMVARKGAAIVAPQGH